MPVLTLCGGELSWGDLQLLDRADFSLEAGERVGLIGRNGTGKSSFLQCLARIEKLDGGELRIESGLNCVYVEQEPVIPACDTVTEALEQRGGFDRIPYVNDRSRMRARLLGYLHRLNLAPDISTRNASGGEKKKAALALALSLEPDLLLLDEPTNHLDVDTILRLEEIVRSEYRGSRSMMVITHDRAFLDATVTRIIELDRGILRSYPGNFSAYERRKGQELSAEALERSRFDKFLAQEEVWIRRGIEARRTRNEGRVRRLEAMRRKLAGRRNRPGHIQITLDAGERSGKIVAEAKNISKSFGNHQVLKDFSFTLMRGAKLGIIGKNGSGKTSLIRLLLAESEPDAGSVRLGTNLRIAYFDQLREQLDDGKTVADTISPGSEWVETGGTKKHIMSYLSDFLFPARYAEMPVGNLSGGERNRLLLARLFALPANLLVLDEPTNDLDIDSLELLEESLAEYPGTIILVSHDRRFLDNVVYSVLAPLNYAQPDGRWMEFAGGYADWLRQRPPLPQKDTPSQPGLSGSCRSRTAPAKVRMSYRESRELEELPGQIEALEAEQSRLFQVMADNGYHLRPPAEQKKDRERADKLPLLIETAWSRWEELSRKAEQAQKKETR